MNNKGFTIIETLIAITILMIAISGPLVVASKGSAGAITARDQMIASYLAQESMETIKNLRDNNIANPVFTSWLTGLNISSTCYATNHSCDASSLDSPAILSGGATMLTLADGTTTYPLYISANGYYSHNSSNATQTIFTRYFYLSAVGGSGPCVENNAQNECTANVVVLWNEGSTPYSVNISSEMTNTSR